MEYNYLSNEKRNIKLLMNDLSNALQVNIESISFIEDYLDKILLKSENCSLKELLERYQDLFIKEMGAIITDKITPSIQFGIKTSHFTVTAFGGKMNVGPNVKDVDDKTLYSIDSISKIMTSIVTLMAARDGKIALDKPVNEYNSDFALNATPEEIMRFVASISTEKRIDNLTPQETIEILKKCKNDLEKVNNTPNFFQYNDIGYMILRLSIPDFLERLDTVLNLIDEGVVTYKNLENKEITTGGKKGEEYLTQDRKGRGITFPGHAGLYANMTGLLNMYFKVLYANDIISDKALDYLCQSPYEDPHMLNTDSTIKRNEALGFNYYISKAGGFYFVPNGVNDMNKIKNADIPTLTTNKAKVSTGTGGSWVMGDDLSYNDKFGPYTGGILTNPYAYIEPGSYPDNHTPIEETSLDVTKTGVIYGYPGKLNPYKEIVAKFGLVVELLTEYAKGDTKLRDQLENCTITPHRIDIEEIKKKKKIKLW